MTERFGRAEEILRRGIDHVRKWFDPPLESDATPLEVREAVLEDIERRVEPAGGGRRVLPYDQVLVFVLAAQKGERARLQATLAGLEDAVAARLKEIHCSAPAAMKIEIRFLTRPRPDWAPNQRMAVEFAAREGSARTAGVARVVRTLSVTVVRGAATQPAYSLAERHIRIGRSPNPVDGRGRARINHIVFLEDGDEHSRTVGRAHASLVCDEGGEYRLFDDGSHNGTRIVRDGRTLEIGPRDPVGVTVKSGDEIQVGTAALRVELH